MTSELQQRLDQAFDECPLVAILRGITPDEIDAVTDTLIDAGFRMIEVPLNSPSPWESLTRLRARCPESVLYGAGTVLDAASVQQLSSLGADLMVTPNTNPELIRLAKDRGLAPLIGCMTPSEALAAAQASASALKLFPAGSLGYGYFLDLKAVLPTNLPVLAVGGIRADNLAQWHNAGIDGFGIGSTLYKPGRKVADIASRARELIDAWREIGAKGNGA